VFLLDVWQQVLFAQHPGLHAFSLATFDKMHARAESGVAATGNIIATTSDIAILLSTVSPISTRSARRLSRKASRVEFFLLLLLVETMVVRPCFSCVFSFAFLEAFCEEESSDFITRREL
jgi:hypothetical protein